MDLEGKTILITGGAGFIGSHLADRLLGHRLIVLDDFSAGSLENLSALVDCPNVEVIEGDVGDVQLLQRLLPGVDVVFHLACRAVRRSIGRPLENHEVNATGTLRLLQAARQARVQRFVHVSSSEVYGTATYVPMDEAHACFPNTVYGGAKLAGEAYARAYHQTYGLPTVVVRPFNNFGPRSHFLGDSGEVIPRFIIWALNEHRPLVFGDGTQTRDFIYVEDTAHWLVQIACCDQLVGRTINLGSGQETSVLELAKMTYDEVGQRAAEPIFRDPRPGDVLRLSADASLAHQILGFHTRTDLRTGIRNTIEYFRQQGGSPSDLLSLIEDTNWSIEPTETTLLVEEKRLR